MRLCIDGVKSDHAPVLLCLSNASSMIWYENRCTAYLVKTEGPWDDLGGYLMQTPPTATLQRSGARLQYVERLNPSLSLTPPSFLKAR